MQKELPSLGEKFAKNWVYKLVAFVVALSIWVTTLHSRKDTILLRRVEVQFTVKPNYAVDALEQKFINVKVAGPRLLLKKYNQSVPVVNVDLTNEEVGSVQVRLRPEDLVLPAGIKFISFEPKQIDVQIKEVQ